jgi:hypothetical protein
VTRETHLPGRRLLAKRNAKALNAGEVEDRRLMRFNNTIAAMLLGGAQLAFLLGLEVVGWGLSLVVAAAAGVALAGFCVGCFFYYRYRTYRSRVFGKS